jgi:hypothetical protein
MFTITVPRADVTAEVLANALRQGLGLPGSPRYNVLPGVGVNWNPVGNPRPHHSDSVVVGTGSNRLFRAQVRISRRPGETILHVSPGGVSPPPRLINRFWIARRVLQVLRVAPGLR